jgi:hypothetical protein
MTVWIITIGGRINSVWADEDAADRHVARLIEVNGDQITPVVVGLEVRE